jgi:hypothetical protein
LKKTVSLIHGSKGSKKHGKAPQNQARQDGKVPTLPGQEMADSSKTESAIFF